MGNKKYTPNTLLRQAREQQNLKQQALAEKIGTTALNIGRWERGAIFPSNYYRLRLCEFFNKTNEELGLIRERYQVLDVEDNPTQPAFDTKSNTEQEEHVVPHPISATPVHPLRKKHWLLVAIVTCVVLVGIVGVIIAPMLWPFKTRTSAATTATSSTRSAPCAAAPILIEPVDGQTLNSRTAMLTWEAPQGCLPEGYTVRISANYDPEARPWIIDTGWAPTDYKYTFSTDGTYYWHIRACKPCNPFHPGSWAIRIFTIHT